MAKEYFSWSVKLLEWRQDLIFDQRYRNSKDESEKAIFTNINSIIESIEKDNGVEDQSLIRKRLPIDNQQEENSKQKDMKIGANIYSCAYFSLIKDNKKKYKMTQQDQFDVIYKATMIFAIQMFFCHCLYFLSGVKTEFFNNTPL